MKEIIVPEVNTHKEISVELAKILADEYVLSNKTRYAQWHIEGSDYYAIHKTFKMQFEWLENFITRVAKRIGLFGHYVPHASPSFLRIAHIKNIESNKKDCKELIKELLTDHETLIETLKIYIHHFSEEYHDTETADFIAELKKDHEQIVGLLQSHL
jgi:starvation-inducible DNA-binding protein